MGWRTSRKTKECSEINSLMYIKIVVIGANELNTEEIKQVVVDTIGENAGVDIVSATIRDDYRSLQDGDMYVCLINRKEEIEAAFGAHRVVAMEFVPPANYFLWLSKIPAGNTVTIFNNSTAGTRVLTELLQRYEIDHVDFVVVPYDEWPEEKVIATLSQAKYITGGFAYVGEGRTLYTRYRHALRDDVTVIVSPPRVAKSASLSRLAREFSSLCHQRMTIELQRLATIDYLTGIPNRRIFDETLALEWERAKRDKTQLSLCIIDIDHFKIYNDCYGHVTGDQCLVRVAEAIRKGLKRPADFCARYGGEEFAVILPNTDAQGAWRLVDGIRQAVENLNITNECLPDGGYVTVSGGITTGCPADEQMAAMNLTEFVKRSDKALYQAKNEGRNRVAAFPPVK